MAIEIKKVDSSTVTINGKEVIMDMDGKWICHERLTPTEEKAFRDYFREN